MTNRNSLDHLGKIYFDNKKKKPPSNKPALFLILIGVAAITVAVIIVFSYKIKLLKPKNYSLYLSSGNPIKIEYNFKDNPAAKLTNYTLELQGLDLSNFKILQFNARHLKNKGTVNLKIEIESSFREISHIYVNSVTEKWSSISVKLEDFKKISRWESIKSISFLAEEWNAGSESKIDTIYIEDVRLAK